MRYMLRSNSVCTSPQPLHEVIRDAPSNEWLSTPRGGVKLQEGISEPII